MQFERTLENRMAAVNAAQVELSEELASAGVDARARYAVDLVLEELASNAVRYGWPQGAKGCFEIRAELFEHHIELELIDDAAEFDPTRVPEPPRPTSLDDAPIGGRGLQLVRRAVAEWRHARRAGRNHNLALIARTGSAEA